MVETLVSFEMPYFNSNLKFTGVVVKDDENSRMVKIRVTSGGFMVGQTTDIPKVFICNVTGICLN